MEITAKLFNKDGQTVWTSKNGNTVSSCIEANVESLDLENGFIREEKMLFWVKGNSEEVVTKTATQLINSIKAGKLATYRAFSTEPFSANDTKDINPSTGAELNRYSQVRLCPMDKFESLHREYVVNEVNAPVNVENIPL